MITADPENLVGRAFFSSMNIRKGNGERGSDQGPSNDRRLLLAEARAQVIRPPRGVEHATVTRSLTNLKNVS